MKTSTPVDNSQLQEFKNCQFRYYLHYKLGYKKRREGDTEHDRNFGSGIHAALETHYKGGEWGAVRDKFAQEYPTQLDQEDQAKTQQNGLIVLEAYRDQYQVQDRNWEVIACEEVGQWEIAPGVIYVVKIDLIVRDRQNGGIYVVDHKTTGKTFDYRYWSQFEPNSQITGYCAYAEWKYGECSGAYINGIRLGYRSRKYKDEPAGFYYEFQRQMFNRNQRQVANWKKDAVEWAEQLQLANQLDRWGKNMGQCGWCSYAAICKAEWDPRDEGDRECIEIQYERVDARKYLKEGESGTTEAA